MLRALVIFGLMLPLVAEANNDHKHTGHEVEHKSYAGQQTREAASFSASDITALRNGEGWGLARPAELNGYPGPLHLLQLANQLELTANQIAQIRIIFDSMKTEAQSLGHALIDAEKELDSVFAEGTATPEIMDAALKKSSELRMALRKSHLSAHLKVTPLLTQQQRHSYQMLRGYGGTHNGHGSH